MPKRIFWKKGMRLTDEVLMLSDHFHSLLADQAFSLAAAGRFGLFPSARPFRVDLDFNKNAIDVTALSCLAVTRGGCLIDIHYTSDYTQPFSTRVLVPDQAEGPMLLLVCLLQDTPWKDANDGTCEPVYAFKLVDEDSPVPDNAFPIARIVDDMGWREDNVSFLPPCLYLSSHPVYGEMRTRFSTLLKKLDVLVPERLTTEENIAKRILFPEIQRLMVEVEQEQELLTPESLLARVQQCVGSFFCACELDEDLTLSEAEKFHEFSLIPYQNRSTYRRLQEGLELLSGICLKLEGLELARKKPVELPTPFIAESDLYQSAVSNDIRVRVSGLTPDVTVYYSVDDETPSTPLPAGDCIPLNPGFNKTRMVETDRQYVIRLKAVQGRQSGPVGTFYVIVHKDINVWKGFQI